MTFMRLKSSNNGARIMKERLESDFFKRKWKSYYCWCNFPIETK